MGNKFKEVRERLGLTQKEFSDLLGIKQSYYSAIERDEKSPSANVVKSLISLGVPAEWYYADSDEVELPELDISTKSFSHKDRAVSTKKMQSEHTHEDNHSLMELSLGYKDGKFTLQQIASTFARFSFEHYKQNHKTDFGVNSFGDISETFKVIAGFFELLQVLMKNEVESSSREALLNPKDYEINSKSEEVIMKYNKIYDEYMQYKDVINKIANLVIDSNPKIKDILHKIVVKK